MHDIYKLKECLKMATVLGEVIKSSSDNRMYRAIRLPNQLECLLIHDPDSQRSSVALSVGAGSFLDPVTAQGLAHYLEHMLFMGTERYPNETDYSNFISKNAGKNNGYTSQEQTNYMFEVASTALEEGLDRFAQFFIAPLLKQESAEKEIHAVDSEHQKNKQDDQWRKWQLIKHIAKEGHPFNKFNTGCKTTLTCPNLQDMLEKFYRANYSANLMKLVVEGSYHVEVMQGWVVEKFGEIADQNLERFQLDSIPFDDRSFGKLFKVLPVKDLKKLELTWILPNKKQHYRHHPGLYISSLIGHEGKGSILSYLIREGLASTLSCGNQDTFNSFTELEISIGLTEKGLSQINQIVGYILFYIKMLREGECPRWFFEELQLINNLKFQFMDKKKGMAEASSLAKHLQERQVEELLVYPYLMDEWRPDLIKEYLNELRLDNLIILCQAKKFEAQCDLEEPVYSTRYCIEKVLDLKELECDVSLPENNVFLPKDLTVLAPEEERLPIQVCKSDFVDAFFKKDHRFGLPKVDVNIRLVFDGSFSAVADITRTIFLEMFKESVREFVYLANMAEIKVRNSFVSYISLEMNFKGFKDSLKLFLVEYLRRLLEFRPIDAQLFANLVDNNRRKYANSLLDVPYTMVYSKGDTAMRNNYTVPAEHKLQKIGQVTLEDVDRFGREWKRKLFLECYFAGNLIDSEAKTMALAAQELLKTHSTPFKKELAGQMRTVMLPANEIHIIEESLQNKTESNEAVFVSFQHSKLTVKEELLLKLSESLLKDPAFDYLRTQSQLGYVVLMMAEDYRGVGALSLLVQSSTKTSHELIGYIDSFLESKAKDICEGLSQEVFDHYKSALLTVKAEKDKNMKAETSRYWSEIVKHRYIFDRKQQELDTLAGITLPDLKQFLASLLFSHPKRLEIHLTSDHKKAANEQARKARCNANPGLNLYSNTESFQRKMSLYPDFYAPNPLSPSY